MNGFDIKFLQLFNLKQIMGAEKLHSPSPAENSQTNKTNLFIHIHMRGNQTPHTFKSNRLYGSGPKPPGSRPVLVRVPLGTGPQTENKCIR